jgi:hypothetical protein
MFPVKLRDTRSITIAALAAIGAYPEKCETVYGKDAHEKNDWSVSI